MNNEAIWHVIYASWLNVLYSQWIWNWEIVRYFSSYLPSQKFLAKNHKPFQPFLIPICSRLSPLYAECSILMSGQDQKFPNIFVAVLVKKDNIFWRNKYVPPKMLWNDVMLFFTRLKYLRRACIISGQKTEKECRKWSVFYIKTCRWWCLGSVSRC